MSRTTAEMDEQWAGKAKWHPVIASLMAEHYMESEEWWRAQATGVASVLYEVILALDVPRDAEPQPGDTFLFGSWPSSAVIAAAKTRLADNDGAGTDQE
jgi:hypothetical protein